MSLPQACQQYGLATNMKAVHDNNLSFWSPQPYFIGAFFFPQQICQLIWLYKLWKGTGQGAVDKKRGDDNVTKAQKEIAGATSEEDLQQMVDYTPIYALGNICIGSTFLFSPPPLALALEDFSHPVQHGCSFGTGKTSRPLTSSAGSTLSHSSATSTHVSVR